MKHHPSIPASVRTLLLAVAAVAVLPALSAADYPATVLADQPLSYYRLNVPARSNVNLNRGSLGAAGNATNLNTHPVGGAIAGSRNGANYFNGTGARAIVPFNPALNPDSTKSFTIEAWIQPTFEVTDSPGPAPLMNRYSYSGVNRQGWVFFQRSPTTGWNFRTYIGSGSTVGISLTGQASTPDAGKAGTWNHLVVVYDGPTTTATMYVNGENVAEGSGGYQANTDGHGAEAVNGPAGLGIGSYNNTQPGDNAFTGAVDEVALYASGLSAADVLAHYQNGLNALRTTSYDALVLAANPVAYLRFDDASPDTDVAVNFGSIRSVGDGAHAEGVNHPVSGAVAGTSATAARYGSRVSGGGVQTLVPWKAELNPPAGESFTVEAWFQPGVEVTDGPGPAPIMNRYSYSGVNRQGWVYFQRSPTTGWNFRAYKGAGSSVGIDITGQASNPDAGTAGSWNHVVTVYDGPNKTATMYVNGEQVAQGTGDYVANTDDHDPAEAIHGAAGVSIGSYNNTQLGDNAYTGAVAEFALYHDLLSEAQIQAHYKAGTNNLRDSAYAAVVLADAPVGYLRLGEPAYQPVANSGSLGEKADGNLLFAEDIEPGPRPPALSGFDAGNNGIGLNGVNPYVSLGNPDGLNFGGQISIEAWIKPAIGQLPVAQIVAHGLNVAADAGVSLAIVDGGTTYSVSSTDANGPHGATFAVPAGDLGGTEFIHLVGTYDGAKWNLYRNGALVASNSDAVGAVPVNDALWAIGHSGNGGGEPFDGVVDEIAIYKSALSAAQVKAHYDAAAASVGPSKLNFTRTATGLSLQWTSGVLQQSGTYAGVYGDVPGATSSYSVTADASARFFRLRK